MKKDKELIEKLEKIDLVFLASHLGFTPVSKSLKYYTLEEHDSFMIKLQDNTFQWYSRGNYGNAISMCMYLGGEVDKRFQSYGYSVNYLEKLYLQMKDNIIVDNIKPHENIKKDPETLKLPFPANNNKKYTLIFETDVFQKKLLIILYITNGFIRTDTQIMLCLFPIRMINLFLYVKKGLFRSRDS